MARGEPLFIGGSRAAWNKQFVWPREGWKGRTPRNWWGGLKSIITNTGPDIFVTRKNDTTPIKPDQWGNWDSYDSPEAQLREQQSYNGVYNAGRRHRRYDPHTRKYVRWEYDNNYDQDPRKEYPLFTRKEHDWLARHPRRRLKSKDWSVAGPKRFRREHNDFWRSAFRVGENIRGGIPDPELNPVINAELFMDNAWLNLCDRRQGRWPPRRHEIHYEFPVYENVQHRRGQIRRPMYDYRRYMDDRRYNEGGDYEEDPYYPYYTH